MLSVSCVYLLREIAFNFVYESCAHLTSFINKLELDVD